MTKEHLEIAYWSVVKDIEASEDIPVACLKATLPIFLSSTDAPAKAGTVIYNCLSEFSWDWPAWNDYAKKVGYESIQGITTSVAKMSANEVLESLSTIQLKQLCREQEIEQVSRSTKVFLVTALLKAIDNDAIYEMVVPFRRNLQETLHEKCRKQMSLFMATRILRVSYNMYRYEQLSDLDLLKRRPFWRFVWGGGTNENAPESCQRFDNIRLPYLKARQEFPVLPCNYLQCGCRIVADKGHG